MEPSVRRVVNLPGQIVPLKPPASQWVEVRTCAHRAVRFGLIGLAVGMLNAIIYPFVPVMDFAIQWLFSFALPMDFLDPFTKALFPVSLAPMVCGAGAIVWYLASWFILIWVFRFGGVASKLALAVCGGLALGLVAFDQHLASQVDWTEHRLDATRPGFEPQMVILAGTMKPRNAEEPEGQFEIRIAGPEHYFLHQTWPDTWRHRHTRRTELALPGWAGWTGKWPRRRNGTLGCGPSGGVTRDHPEWLMPGRGLWPEATLTGAKSDGQLTSQSLPPSVLGIGPRQEEYRRLERIGRWQIPREITFQHLSNVELVYTVRRIELLPVADRKWFSDRKAWDIAHGASYWEWADRQGAPSAKPRK